MDWFAQQLNYNLHWVANIIGTVSLIMGVFMLFSGIVQFRKCAESRSMMSQQHGATGPLMMVLAGSALMALPSFLDVALLAFWSTDSPLAYQGGPSGYSALIPPILMFVRIVGVVSFIRGIVLLSKVGGQQTQHGTLSRALIHLLSGVLCIHILGTIELMESVLGLA